MCWLLQFRCFRVIDLQITLMLLAGQSDISTTCWLGHARSLILLPLNAGAPANSVGRMAARPVAWHSSARRGKGTRCGGACRRITRQDLLRSGVPLRTQRRRCSVSWRSARGMAALRIVGCRMGLRTGKEGVSSCPVMDGCQHN